MAFKIVVIGGGTAGVMSSTYLKSYWGDLVDVTMVYDHKNPGIGVGESLTPTFDSYLKTVGVTTQELIKNCNATIKLGLRFKNWAHEGSDWFHNFAINEAVAQMDQTVFDFNAVDAYDILHDQYDGSYGYDWHYFNNNLIPHHNNLTYRHALHVDANLVGRYIEEKFKDKINIIDALVVDVLTENNNIKSVKFNNGLELTADLFIDASGLERVLFKNLDAEWVDISKILPTNRTIPNPMFKTYDYIPPYTTADATKNGWILDVPLSNRRGTGYVYCSEFTTDEEAKEDFNKWLIKTHGTELKSDRVIKFKNGYWKTPWVGNCIALGLSGGFVEPLEATSLHHTFMQLTTLTRVNCLENLEYDRKNYNKFIGGMYENAFQYVRFFYHTKRQDSDFWRNFYDNQPDWLQELDEKISNSFIGQQDFNQLGMMFDATSFTSVAYGHGMFKNKQAIEKYLKNRYLFNHAERFSNKIRAVKSSIYSNAIDHKTWIDSILRS